ncbi:MAG: Fic family protein [Alphaproteobacteria bacterium]|nr:Fic family protein [Alphaproteobacteria bacterium]
MPNNLDIIITPEMLNGIAEIDAFNGAWAGGAVKLSADELRVMRRVATIESVGSSNRIEGNRMTDAEIEALFANINRQSFATRDEQEVAGYSDVINTIFENYASIPLSENYIKQLHKMLLNYSDKDVRHRGEYKKDSNRVAAFDANGNEIGSIFETATPFDTPRKMSETIRWTNDTLDDRFFHPIITIGVFVIHFLSIHPFTDGNGRLSRALTVMLMLKSGYTYMPYTSMESIIEATKDTYYRALRGTQKTIWGDKINYEPWLTFFVRALVAQKRQMEDKIAKARGTSIAKLSAIQKEILEQFHKSPELTMQQIVSMMNKNPETIRKAVQVLVKRGHISKQGSTRGAFYTLYK